MRTEDYNDLQSLLETWFGELDAGRQPDPESICAGRPDLLQHFERIVSRKTGIAAALAHAGRTASLVGSDAAFPMIEGYEIITKLGSGGRGDVYLARQASLDRLVALKVLHAGLASDPTATANARRRLIREAELTALLEHPNIVPIYDVGEAKKTVEPAPMAYIAMKWLSGPGLDQVGGTLDGDEVARIGIAVASALHEAHMAGIVHRDIKPANIMLDRGEPRVVDFGLARESSSVTNTIEGQVSGTLPYMSPEQLRAGAQRLPLDGRTDIYSLGVTLYELMTGEPPFLDDNPGALIHQILLRDVPRLRDCDVDLATILYRALDKDRDRRFETARAFAEELTRYRNGEPIRSRPAGFVRRTAKRVRRYPRASAAVAASLLSAVVLGGVLGWQKLQAAREFDAKVGQVTQALIDEDFRLAGRLLDQLPEGTSEAVSLREELQAERALEDILDRLQSRRGSLNLETIEGLSRSVSGGVRRPERREVWALAMATCRMLSSERESVDQELAKLAPSRARAALVASNAATPWPWQLPVARPRFVWDHLFAVVAMRAARVERAAIRAELESAERIDRANYRVRKHYLEWLAEDKRNLPAVLEGLKSLFKDGRYPRSVVRGILHAACVLQDESEVAVWLRYFLSEERFPRDRWTGIDAAIVGYCHQLLGDTRALDGLLERSLRSWPRSASLWLLEAAQRGRRRDVRGALDATNKAIEYADRPGIRNRAKVNLLRARCRALGNEPNPSVTEIDGLRRAVTELLAVAKDPEVRSEGCVVLVDLAVQLGELDVAEAWLERAFVDPAHATPLAHLSAGWLAVRLVSARMTPGQSELDSDQHRAAEKGREHIRLYLLPESSRGSLGLGHTNPEAYVCQAILADYAGASKECREAVRMALDLGGEELTDRQFLLDLAERHAK